MSQRTQLLNELNITNNIIVDDNSDHITVTVQPIANSAQNLKDEAGLTDHLEEFAVRIGNIKSDVLILTELNRGLTDDQKEEIAKIMSNNGYELVDAFTKNGNDSWSMQTAMYYNPTQVELNIGLTFRCSYSAPNEFRDFPLCNGVVLAIFSKNDYVYKIGAIHSSLILHLGQKHMYDIICDEWKNISDIIDEGYSMFGDLNISDGLLYLAGIKPNLADNLAPLPFVGLDKIDFICGNKDFVPRCVSDFVGNANIIERGDGCDRIINTLGKAIGNNVKPVAMYHPVTFEDITDMTNEEIINMTIGLDFTTGCFDHCTATYIVQHEE